MGCYISTNKQVILAEESRIQEATSLVLEHPISKQRSIQSSIEPSSRVSLPSDTHEDESKRGDSETVPEEDDFPLTAEEVVGNDDPTTFAEVHTRTIAEQAEEPLVPMEDEEEQQIPSRAKTACCGRSCQLTNSRFCCEHNFGRPVEYYCKPCRERYEEWREANDAFEEIVQEMENQLRSSGKIGLSSLESGESNKGENSWGEHPVDDDWLLDSNRTQDGSPWSQSKSPQEADSILPCGHLSAPDHEFLLDPCQESRPRRCLWDWSTDSDPQSERQNTVHSSVKIGLANLRRSAQSQVLLCEPKTSAVAAWSPDKRRFMYLSQTPMVSSLSLGDSSTGSMRSF